MSRLLIYGLTSACLMYTGFASAATSPPKDAAAGEKNANVKIMPRPKAWDDIDTPLTASVTAKNPLKVDLCTSYRSPYAYVGMDRYAALAQKYNVEITPRYV